MHPRDLRRRHLRWQAACVLDAQGRFLNASPSLAAFLRTDGGSLDGQRLTDHMEAAEASQLLPLLAAAAGGAEQVFQMRLRRPGGAPTWMRVSLRPGGIGQQGPVVVACLEPP